MFKRRKPDEPELAMAPDPKPEPAGSLFAPAPVDTGLGVPPRPPLDIPSPSPKDSPMAQPPFSMAANNGPTNPPIPPSMPPRPPGPPSAVRPVGAAAVPVERRTLVVGRGISLKGVVQDAERLVVEGTVEATMINASELAVSPGGIFKGEIEVEEAEVAGTIEGTVVARGNLIVRASGVVLGTARCRRLQVEDGGQISGNIEMISAAPSPAAPPAPPPHSFEN